VLVRKYRNRHGSDRYVAYRPVLPDQVRQLACYSANLVALRVLLEPYPSGILLAELFGVPIHAALGEWRITPLLWRSGLDADGLRAMLTLLEMTGSPPRLYTNERDLSLIPLELSLARLIGDEATEKRLRYGTAIYDEVTYFFDAAYWADMMKSWLIPAIAGIGSVPEQLPAPPEEPAKKDIVEVAKLIFDYLRTSPYDERNYERILRLLFLLPPVYPIDSLALTSVALGRPQLRVAVPELQDFELYGEYAEMVRRGDNGPAFRLPPLDDPPNEIIAMIKVALAKYVTIRGDANDFI